MFRDSSFSRGVSPRCEILGSRLKKQKQAEKTVDKGENLCYNPFRWLRADGKWEKSSGSQDAGIAQLVEQLICNQQVGGSSPSTSST